MVAFREDRVRQSERSLRAISGGKVEKSIMGRRKAGGE
jgi:hypothetical protein